MKAEVMERLGGKCVICGKNNIRILTIHHKKNDGAQDRRFVGGRGGGRFYEYLLKNKKDFSGLECRCFSCNDAVQRTYGILEIPKKEKK